MKNNTNLTKDYQDLKNIITECVSDECKAEGYDVNELSTGRFFEVLDELEKNGFEIGDEKVESMVDCEDNAYELSFTVESESSDDKFRFLTISVGLSDALASEKGSEFCIVDMYAEYFNDNDFDGTYYMKREDMPKLAKWLNEALNSGSPDEVLKNFEKEGLDA